MNAGTLDPAEMERVLANVDGLTRAMTKVERVASSLTFITSLDQDGCRIMRGEKDVTSELARGLFGVFIETQAALKNIV